jgi:predicted phosphodiesterase
MALIRFICASDNHGDMQDDKAVNVFFKFLEVWKPSLRIHLGDLWDFRPLRTGACDEERRETLRDDYKAGRKFFERFKPHYFLRGNHDERLWELAAKVCGLPSDYARELIGEIEVMTAHHKCQVLPYHKRDGVLRIGHLKMIHGFYCGVYAARQTAMTYGSCLFGHTHVIDEHAIPGLDRRVARGIGALCKLDMDYNARKPNTLRQAHGFSYGLVNEKTGAYHVTQAEQVDGKWILPVTFKEL